MNVNYALGSPGNLLRKCNHMTAILVSKKILIIGFVWPEPNSTAAGSRMLQLLLFFKDNNYQITFASTAQESELLLGFGSLGCI